MAPFLSLIPILIAVPPELSPEARLSLQRQLQHVLPKAHVEILPRADIYREILAAPETNATLRTALLLELKKKHRNKEASDALLAEMRRKFLSDTSSTLPWSLLHLLKGLTSGKSDPLVAYVSQLNETGPEADVRAALTSADAAQLGSIRKFLRKSPKKRILFAQKWPESCLGDVEGRPLLASVPALDEGWHIRERCAGGIRKGVATTSGDWNNFTFQHNALPPESTWKQLQGHGLQGLLTFGTEEGGWIHGELWLDPTGERTTPPSKFIKIPVDFSASDIKTPLHFPTAATAPLPVATPTPPPPSRTLPCSAGVGLWTTVGSGLVLGHHGGTVGWREGVRGACRISTVEVGANGGFSPISAREGEGWGPQTNAWHALWIQPELRWVAHEFRTPGGVTIATGANGGLLAFQEAGSHHHSKKSMTFSSLGIIISVTNSSAAALPLLFSAGGGALLSPREVLATTHLDVSWRY